jgi:protein-tyrosine phosphatase
MKPEIYWIPEAECGPLAIMPRPRAGEWLEEELAALKREGVAVVVSLLTAAEEMVLDLTREAELSRAAGLEFRSFPIADRGLPSSCGAVRRFLGGLGAACAQGEGIAIHCRAGIGRSALMAACLLIDAGCAPSAALARIGAARGWQVPDTEEQRAWVEAYARWSRSARDQAEDMGSRA